jgi:uncharacterized protein YjbI with pentapeptide repeats
MAAEEHLKMIRQGVDVWNEWRQKNPKLLKPDFRQADLRPVNLEGANLRGADLWMADLEGAKLRGADLSDAHLWWVDLRKADLTGADLHEAFLERTDLEEADLTGANLRGANLTKVYLGKTNLCGADLTGVRFKGAQLIGTDLRNATLTGSFIYGVSVWDIQMNERTEQQNLIITDHGEPVITVDNIEVAQFIYLLLNNQAIRKAIDAITSKAVLILGRFSEKRKPVLDAIREELRKHNYLPILFDFNVPANRDITETVSLLARMARFIIADLTDPSSIPKELEAIVPSLAVPVQPLLEGLARPYAMFKDYWKYDWVLPPYRYEGLQLLLAALAEKVIAPAEAKVTALEERRRAIEVALSAPRTEPTNLDDSRKR